MKYLKEFKTESDYKTYRDSGGGGTFNPMYPSVMTMTKFIII